MATGIDDLLANLAIREEGDKEVTLADDLISEALNVEVPRLIAKVLTRKVIKADVLRSALSNFWKLKGNFRVVEVGDKIFEFDFDRVMDKERILQNQPWNHNRSLMIFQEYNGLLNPTEIDFEWCPFWIQLHGLPPACMTEKIAQALGQQIGFVEEIKKDQTGVSKGRFLKLKIRIPVNKPLLRSLSVNLPEIGRIKVSICYERLGDFCYVCGCIVLAASSYKLLTNFASAACLSCCSFNQCDQNLHRKENGKEHIFEASAATNQDVP